MTSKQVLKILEQANGSHLEKIYVPSLQQFVLFWPLTTAQAKTLMRINFVDKYDLSVELLKLGLFDKLCAEDLSDKGLNSNTITLLDYLSFLIGLRQLLKNDITFSFVCKKCGSPFQKKLNLAEIFDEDIEKFRPQHEQFVKLDEQTGKMWKFELANFSMKDYLYYKFVLQQMKEKTKNNPDVMHQTKFMRPILYIKNIYLNDQLIQDWPSLTFPAKLSFFNKISPNVTLNETPSNKSLCGFIFNTFAEQHFERKIKNMQVECQHCKHKYKGVYKFDNFFIFQGLRATI